jgi:hypothetical protein
MSTTFTPTYKTETVDGLELKIRNSDGYVSVVNFGGCGKPIGNFMRLNRVGDMVMRLAV